MENNYKYKDPIKGGYLKQKQIFLHIFSMSARRLQSWYLDSGVMLYDWRKVYVPSPQEQEM